MNGNEKIGNRFTEVWKKKERENFLMKVQLAIMYRGETNESYDRVRALEVLHASRAL